MEIKLMQLQGGTCSFNGRSDAWLPVARAVPGRIAALCVQNRNLWFVPFLHSHYWQKGSSQYACV